MMQEKRRLGKSNIEVTPIGLGCWQFSQGQGMIGKVWGDVEQQTITSVVKTTIDGGISWFDTAEAYGKGRSEQTLSAALQALKVAPGSVTIATKWFPLMRTAGSISRTITTRLDCLSPYPIDLYQIHQPFSFSSIPAQMRAMARILREGKIRSVGVSNFSARQMEAAHAALQVEGVALVSNQVRISMLHRAIEDDGVLAAARRLGVSLIAWSPLAQGVLTGRFHEDPSAISRVSRMRKLMGGLGPEGLARTAPLIKELTAVAAAHDVSPAQVALAWLVGFYGQTVLAIPGATRPAQAAENASAMSLRLTSAELSALDQVSRQCVRLGRHAAQAGGRAA
jgi:aryl-alcohol dehydrogenase-like predicted oxidoreductase